MMQLFIIRSFCFKNCCVIECITFHGNENFVLRQGNRKVGKITYPWPVAIVTSMTSILFDTEIYLRSLWMWVFQRSYFWKQVGNMSGPS